MQAKTPKNAPTAAEDAVRNLGRMAPLPQTAQQVVQAVGDPEVGLAEVGELLALDPALTANVLRVANSAFYGVRAEVVSLPHAATLLGPKVVRNIALAVSLGPLLRGGDLPPRFAPVSLWRHSVACAAAARVLAGAGGEVDEEEAFAAGLLHDLGVVALALFDAPALLRLLEVLPEQGGALRGAWLELEERHLPATHGVCGELLCGSWSFPEALAAVARWHHAPLEAPPVARSLVAAVYAAEQWGIADEHGVAHPAEAMPIEPAVLDALGLDAERVEELGPQIEAAIGDALAAFPA